MSERPTITVVTVCRNALALLQSTVESVRAQECAELEYWIVDGDSTDGTKDYLQTLSADGVRWISEPDGGIADAMNKGVRLASGEWIAHLHAGDSYLRGTLEVVARHLAATPECDVLCGSILKREGRTTATYGCAPARLNRDMTINHPATWVRRTLFERHGGFDPRYPNAMDYDFFLRLKLAGARFVVVPQRLARMADGGQSERSLWRTLRETHAIRRAQLVRGSERTWFHFIGLYLRAVGRRWLQKVGLGALVVWWRRRFAESPKS